MVERPSTAKSIMATEEIPQIWLQREDETAEAFAAFTAFLEMGVGRTVRDAYRQTKGKPEAREASNNWRQWSTRLEWFKRADAFDRYHAALDRQAEERAFAQERRKWASRRATIRDEAWNDAEALRARAREILRLPLSEEVTTDVIVEEGDDGKKTINRTVIVKPLRASMSDAGQMLKHADNLSRLAADMETERVLHDSLEAQKARQLEDARQAYRESKDLYPDETPLARAHALSIAYGFSVEAIMQEPPTLDGESHLS
jgi:hypothetical protein